MMSKTASDRRRASAGSSTITAVVVAAGADPKQVVLTGGDSERFATIGQLVGGRIAAVDIDDQDGPAAIGWVNLDADRLGLAGNPVASAVAERPVLGVMVVTGLGHGDDHSMTSVHPGLVAALARIAAG